MNDLPSVQSVEEILEEEAALTAALKGLAQPALKFAGGIAQSRGDFALASLLPPDTRKRIDSIVRMEGGTTKLDDHTPLVLMGCLVLERELIRLLVEPVRGLGRPLLAGVQSDLSKRQQEALEQWLAGKAPATLGTVELILFALRRGLQQGVPEVAGLVAKRFREGYGALLGTNGPGRAAGRLRTEFRNKAAHGEKEFAGEDYQTFCRLVMANDTFRHWIRQGAWPVPPPPDHGLLHHHLVHVRQPGSETSFTVQDSVAAARNKLLALQTPQKSLLRVRIAVQKADAAVPDRGSYASAPASPPEFRVGDLLRFIVDVEATCYVLVLDFGTNGQCAVLFPNRYLGNARLRQKVLYLPEPVRPECEFPVEGPPGTDVVLALATRRPLGLDLLANTSDVLRRLSVVELEWLGCFLADLPVGAWATAQCRFEVRD